MYDNQAAYQFAVARKIALFAAILRAKSAAKKRAAWLLEDESRVALMQTLHQIYLQKTNRVYDTGNFFVSLFIQYDEWGTLSAKQEAALRSALEKAEASKSEIGAKIAAENATDAATSQHVGAIGDRDYFMLTCVFSKEMEGNMGLYTFHKFRDEFGNVFTSSGVKVADKDQKVHIKATIKDHRENDSVKSTTLNRPKLIAVL